LDFNSFWKRSSSSEYSTFANCRVTPYRSFSWGKIAS
jgi:hypothetical protein